MLRSLCSSSLRILTKEFDIRSNHYVRHLLASSKSKLKMDSCLAVEREVDKVLNKFGLLKESYNRTLDDLICYVQELQNELSEGSYFELDIDRSVAIKLPGNCVICLLFISFIMH